LARRARKRRPGATPSAPPRPGARPARDEPRGVNGRGDPRDDPRALDGRGDDVVAADEVAAPEVAAPEVAGPEAPRESPREAMARGYARGRERDEAAREALVPLAPGERPWPIVVSTVLAAAFAAANVALILAGWEVDGKRPIASGLVFAGIMLAAAIGMWKLRYWAVLGWQVLLAVTFIGALLSLLRAENLKGVALSVAVMAVTGPLFYLLIRQMARIQMPQRPARRDDSA
jgi:hypothetical protein